MSTIASDLRLYLKPFFRSNAPARPSGAASICPPTRAIEAPNTCKLSRRIGYIAYVVSRPKEVEAKRRNPNKKARRWIVEVCHSWINRFRKLLVRYEKLERSFVALNHLAAAIIAFRKVPLEINIIYG